MNHNHVHLARPPRVQWERDPKTGLEYVNVSEVAGPSWWAMLHGWAQAIHDYGCASCGAFAVQAAVALHDLVNVKLEKPVQDIGNFRRFAALFGEAERKAAGYGEADQGQGFFETVVGSLASGLGFGIGGAIAGGIAARVIPLIAADVDGEENERGVDFEGDDDDLDGLLEEIEREWDRAEVAA